METGSQGITLILMDNHTLESSVEQTGSSSSFSRKSPRFTIKSVAQSAVSEKKHLLMSVTLREY